MAKLTLIGMNDYYDRVLHKDFFETLTFPEGIDKDVVIDRLLIRGGEFDVIYTHPEFVHSSFEAFSKSWYKTFKKWYDALELEYEPLYNYDRTESRTITGQNVLSKTGEENEQGLLSKTGIETDSVQVAKVGDETTTDYTSAYNSSDLSITGRSQLNFSADRADNTTANKSFNNRNDHTTNTLSFTDRKDTTDITQTETVRAYGNIGVTTSSQLLLEHLSASEWNLYEHIVDIILREYCTFIY